MAHYHLSATNDLGRSHKATTLILNAAAERARRKAANACTSAVARVAKTNCSLSSGVSAATYIVIPFVDDLRSAAIPKLVERRVAAPHSPAVRSNFFPEYRA